MCEFIEPQTGTRIMSALLFTSYFRKYPVVSDTVEPVLKDHPVGHKNVVSKQVVSGDRFSYIEC